MKLTYLKLEKGVAMLSGKLYECEVLGTFYENGKPSAKIRVSKNGKEVDLFCDMTLLRIFVGVVRVASLHPNWV